MRARFSAPDQTAPLLYTEKFRVFETVLGERLQLLTVSKTALDKLMSPKWPHLLCLCMPHHVRLLLVHTFCKYFSRNAV
jgi:hypothetical protein